MVNNSNECILPPGEYTAVNVWFSFPSDECFRFSCGSFRAVLLDSLCLSSVHHFVKIWQKTPQTTLLFQKADEDETGVHLIYISLNPTAILLSLEKHTTLIFYCFFNFLVPNPL